MPSSSPEPASPPTPLISACIISYNEASNIRECLESVRWCDEIVVIDSFSEDETAEIAAELGARVIREPWAGHVTQKNRAVAAARGDWILSLDCDERVTPLLRERIESLLASGPSASGYSISRKLCYLGRWLEHGGWFPEWRLRLFRRDAGRWVGVDPHDTVEVEGAVGRIDIEGTGPGASVILHYSFRDLSHQLKVLDRYTEIQAGELLRRGRRTRPGDLTLRPLWRFLWTYVLRAGFLDGSPGYQMALNHAYAAYMKYAKLREFESGLATPRAKDELVPARDERTGETPEGARP